MNEPLSLDDHLPDNLRIPPHSQEAEQAVLGGLLLNNEAWDEVAERVGPKDFYRKEHRLIFQVVDQLVEEEKPCDLVTVSQALTHRGELDDVGGMTYCTEFDPATGAFVTSDDASAFAAKNGPTPSECPVAP